MKLICTFTTGRTGTGYLSQLFGNNLYSKKAVHINDDFLITHESWPEIKFIIMKIKKYGHSDEIKKEIIAFVIEKLCLLSNEYGCKNYFITDHRVGRYFGWALIDSNIDIKIIRIDREQDKVSKSFKNRFNKTKALIPEKYDKFYNDIWTKSFYHPNDTYSSLAFSKDWELANDIERLNWYVKETSARWKELKKKLNKSSYIEIYFDDLFIEDEIIGLSQFLNINYSTKYFKKVANK